MEDKVLSAVLAVANMKSGTATSREWDAAASAFYDTLGVMAAGISSQTVTKLVRARFREPVDHAIVRRWLLQDIIPESQLAEWLLIAGTAAHALDFDDVLEPMNGHPSAVLVPLIWGVGRSVGADSAAIMDAYIFGVRVCGAVASQVDVRTAYARGWHATSVIGALAAATSAARLMSLSEDELVHALGMAASLTSGIRQNFGTDTKPLHVGLAARTGYEASWWAKCGLTSSRRALDGRQGWAALFGARETGHIGTYGTSTKPLQDPGLDQKPYPCCYNTQRLATAGVRAHGLLEGRTVQSVHATVESGATQPLIYENPNTGLEAKFSAQYVLAESVLEGALPLSSFADDYVARARSRALIPHITVTESPTYQGRSYEYPNGFANVIVEFTNGEKINVVEYIPWGHHLKPLAQTDLKQKMISCCDYVGMSDSEKDSLIQQISHLTNVKNRLPVLHH